MSVIAHFTEGNAPSFCIEDVHLDGVNLEDLSYVQVFPDGTLSFIDEDLTPISMAIESDDPKFGEARVVEGPYNTTALEDSLLEMARTNNTIGFGDITIEKGCTTCDNHYTLTMRELVTF